MKTFFIIGLLAIALLNVQCQSQTNSQKKLKKAKGVKIMEITSTAFKEGGMIPSKYTCDGVNVSPPLAWNNAPANAKSFAIIADDPDAPMGTWGHWVIFNMPNTVLSLPENVPPEETLKDGSIQGKNNFRKIGYGGPCPPGGVHRYYFKLYALDEKLNLKPGATKAELLKIMKGHILAQAQLMGRYSRK